MESSARRTAGSASGTWPRTASVLDDSYSSFGSPTRRDHPLALALACHHLVSVLSPDSLRIWRHRLEPAHTVSMVRPNPVSGSADPGPRALSPAVPTLGLHDPAAPPPLVEPSRFGQGHLGLSDLRAHLDGAVATYLEKC